MIVMATSNHIRIEHKSEVELQIATGTQIRRFKYIVTETHSTTINIYI